MKIEPQIFSKEADGYTDSCLLGSQAICELLIKAKKEQPIGLKDAIKEAVFLIQSDDSRRGAAIAFIEGLEYIFVFAATQNAAVALQPLLEFYEKDLQQKLQATQQKNKSLLAELN